MKNINIKNSNNIFPPFYNNNNINSIDTVNYQNNSKFFLLQNQTFNIEYDGKKQNNPESKISNNFNDIILKSLLDNKFPNNITNINTINNINIGNFIQNINTDYNKNIFSQNNNNIKIGNFNNNLFFDEFDQISVGMNNCFNNNKNIKIISNNIYPFSSPIFNKKKNGMKKKNNLFKNNKNLLKENIKEKNIKDFKNFCEGLKCSLTDYICSQIGSRIMQKYLNRFPPFIITNLIKKYIWISKK